MELEYELMREFDRVIGQCDQAEKKRLNLNTPDNNNSVSEEQGSMILSITSGFAEAGSSVKNENSGLMEVTEQGCSSFPPQEMMIHGKVDKAVPQFLLKLYEIIDNPNTDYVVQWGFDGRSFVVGDAAIFCNAILPNYFKHCNFSSFIRQLNTYGFRKIDADKWEFAMEEFQRGKRHLLKNIKRKRTENKRGLGLSKKDDILLMIQKAMSAQISNLTQQVQVANSLIKGFEKRVQLVELKYKQMDCVLSQTIQNPGFIAELIQRKVLTESKHGGETSSSEQKIVNTKASDDTTLSPDCFATSETPNQSEMQVSVYIPARSCGDSSDSPTEPQESAVMAEAAPDPLESLHDELMNETEPSGEILSEKCIYYFHELESLITVDEPGEEWATYMDTHPTDSKP